MQISVCVLPITLGFIAGAPKAGIGLFAMFLATFLLFHAIRRDGFSYLSLLLGILPAMVVVRGTLIPFNSLVFLLGTGLLWPLSGRSEFRLFWKRHMLLSVLCVSVLYWWLSYLPTGNYSQNLRSLEWSFCIAVVCLLGARRSYLSTSLVGCGISLIAVGAGLMPYGDRLGMASIDDVSFGNPIQLGLPSALLVLLSLTEGGQWLLLQKRIWSRIALALCCAFILIFSTSRGSWLVLIVGIVLLAIGDRRARKPMLVGTLLLAATVGVVILSPRGAFVQHYFMKVADPNNSAEARTTGRVTQWRAFPEILRDSPVWGFGPGSGRQISVQYAHENIPFHALYLHVGAETGMIGLTLLSILLFGLLREGWIHWRLTREFVPLLGTTAFIMMGLTVSGLDSLGGLLLGLGFLGGSRENLWRVLELPSGTESVREVQAREPRALPARIA
jgi:O-antigen ligase